MNWRLYRLSLHATAALTVGFGAAAHAQVTPGAPSAASDADELSEIVVTARRVEERAQDVPISMSVFDQRQLSERNIVTAGDLAAYTPSMSVDNEFGQDVTSFSIRGFVQTLNTAPSVAVYFADATVPRGGAVGEPAGSGVAPGSFFDLQNLEVLKGPQGTLFGRNTDGGAVLLVPKKPTSDFGGYVEGSYGNFADGGVQAVLNVPLSDNIRVRFGVNHETRTGYLENISGIGPSDFANIDYTAARLSLVVDVTPDLENYLIGTYNLSVNNGPLPQQFACNPNTTGGGQVFACGPALKTLQASGPYSVANDEKGAESYLRQIQVIDTTTWRASDHLTLKNIANYGQLLTGLDSALFGINIYQGAIALTTTESNASATGGLTTDQYTWSDELQLQGDAFHNKLTWQGGGYIERSGPLGEITGSRSANYLTCTNYATLQCGGFGLLDQQLATIHFEDLAAFGQATYSILDNLKATAGARYTDDKSTSAVSAVNWGPAVFPFLPAIGSPASVICAPQGDANLAGNCVQYYVQHSNSPTYVVDLDYNPLPDTMIYGKYSRGYRQGSIATFVAEGFHLFKPEYVNTFELGEKTTLRGPIPGIVNASIFYNDFTNQQLLVGFTGQNATPSSGIVNAGTSHIYGAEFETSITPWRPLTVGLSYTYLATKLISSSFSTNQLPANSGYTTITYPTSVGGPLPYSPKNKGSAYVTYRLPVPESEGNVSLGAVFTYTSGLQVAAPEDDPLAHISPYGLLNVNLAWNAVAGSPVDVEMFSTNITDRLYYNNVTQLFNTPLGVDSRFIGEPRMYGLKVRVHFGK
jgi:iron complex outermembrane receptor protein